MADAKLAIDRKLYLEMAALARKATRQNPPADPRDVGTFLATLAEIDRQVLVGLWRVEVWGEIGYVDPRTLRQRWRLLVAGVGLPYQPASFADFADTRSDLMRNPKISAIVRNFFGTAPKDADLEIAPWAPYVPVYPALGWLWVPSAGDAAQ